MTMTVKHVIDLGAEHHGCRVVLYTTESGRPRSGAVYQGDEHIGVFAIDNGGRGLRPMPYGDNGRVSRQQRELFHSVINEALRRYNEESKVMAEEPFEPKAPATELNAEPVRGPGEILITMVVRAEHADGGTVDVASVDAIADIIARRAAGQVDVDRAAYDVQVVEARHVPVVALTHVGQTDAILNRVADLMEGGQLSLCEALPGAGFTSWGDSGVRHVLETVFGKDARVDIHILTTPGDPSIVAALRAGARRQQVEGR